MDNASIIIKAGLDTTDLSKGFAQAEQLAQNASTKMAKSADHASGAHEKLLGSSHRVAHSISNVSQSMLSGASAATVFATSLEGLEHSLHLPLGGLAILGVGAVLVDQIGKARDEAQKLHEDIAKLAIGEGDAQFTTLDNLTEHLQELNKQLDEAKEKQNSILNKFVQAIPSNAVHNNLAEFLQGHFITAIQHQIADSADGEKEDKKKLVDGQVETIAGIAQKEGERAAVLEDKDHGGVEGQRTQLTSWLNETLGDAMAKYGNVPAAKTQFEELQGNIMRQYNAKWNAIDVKASDKLVTGMQRQAEIDNPSDTNYDKQRKLEALIAAQDFASKQNQNSDGSVANPDKEDDIRAKRAELQTQLDNFNTGLQLQLDTQRDITAELTLQSEGQNTLADQVKLLAGYNERIAEAKRVGNVELETELTDQRASALLIQAEQNYVKTAAQKRAERKHAADLRHAGNVVGARAKDAMDRASRGAYAGHYDGTTTAQRRAGRNHENALNHFAATGAALKAQQVGKLSVGEAHFDTVHVGEIPSN